MVDISHVHVLVNTDCKFSLVCEQNFIPTCLGSVMEIGSVFHLIKAYYHKRKKCFRKRIMPLIFECILEIEKDYTFQFLLALMNTKFSVKLNWL